MCLACRIFNHHCKRSMESARERERKREFAVLRLHLNRIVVYSFTSFFRVCCFILCERMCVRSMLDPLPILEWGEGLWIELNVYGQTLVQYKFQIEILVPYLCVRAQWSKPQNEMRNKKQKKNGREDRVEIETKTKALTGSIHNNEE